MAAETAPAPTWHPTHSTRLCGERRYASYSGCITVWHTVPQNFGVSMKVIALWVTVAMMKTLSTVISRTNMTRLRATELAIARVSPSSKGSPSTTSAGCRRLRRLSR